jgi:hypothetical protein
VTRRRVACLRVAVPVDFTSHTRLISSTSDHHQDVP